MKSYRFLEHATDAIIETTSDTLKNAFLAAAEATIDLSIDKNSVEKKEFLMFEANGENMRHLLYSWLEEIIYVIITRGFAVCHVTIEDALLPASITSTDCNDIDDNSAICNENDSFYIRAKAYGEPLDLTRHGFKVEIKAPTFHDMIIAKRDGQILMRFLLDL